MTQVSVVVPLYNKASYLLRALESIAEQTYRDFEVIVVNDGSTDGGEQVARSFPDRRFRVLSQQNRGPGAARNRGITEAVGQVTAFLDADDEWLPHYLETAVRAFDQRPDLAACTQGYVEYPAAVSSEPMWRRFGLAEGIQTINEKQSPRLLHYMLAYMSSWSTVVRSDTLRKWGGFYEHGCKFGEDSFLWLKILLNEPVQFALQPGVRVHREAGALSQNLNRSRPLEPFLQHPEEISRVCPPRLLPLLHAFFTLRAFKTACVWGYYGEWQRAREIRQKFRTPGDSHIPYYLSSWVCSTPLGAGLGAIWRATHKAKAHGESPANAASASLSRSG